MRMGLRTRMLLSALLPVTLVAAVLTTVFMLRAIDDLEQGLHTRGTAIARQMASAAEFGIFSGQRASLLILTESALQIDPDVRGAAIIDAKGSVMARSGELTGADWPRLANTRGHQVGPVALLFVVQVLASGASVDDIYSGTEKPRLAEKPLLGFVVVELSRRAVVDQSERLISIGVLIAAIGSLLGGALALRIARGVTQPLLAATEVVARIGGGELTARMPPEPAGSLMPLALGINQMAAQIGMTQEELRTRIAVATAGLQREKEAAEHAAIAKSHFLAAASHDLRQPLHALGLFVSGLARSDAAKQEPELVAHIQSAVDSLQNLLNALLDISHLDSGNVVPKLGDFPLNQMLDSLDRTLAPLAEHKSLRLRIRATAVRVRSDEQIVERILTNLVSNALRYTSSGGVLVSCRRRRGDRVLVEVWDTGTGIPESSREVIFEEYVQLVNPERDRVRGLGLGLAICRRLAKLLAVRIGVRSRPGRGSVFWIELPLAPALVHDGEEPAGIAPIEPADDPAQISGTVLVVDGDRLVRNGMERAIAGWGGRVMLAASREEALQRCRELDHPPDLLICNIHLPDHGNGIALAQELQHEFRRMAVLLITADGSEEAETAARKGGFALLKQPVSPGRLRAALRHLLAVRG